MKFGAGADGDPFVKVKDLISDLISRVQVEASSETNQKSYCNEEISKITEKREDLEADVTKHSSRLEAAVARSIELDGEISALQSVQHVVNTVEVEKPKIIELTVQRKKPIIQEKINQGTKLIEFSQAQFLDEAGDMPVVVQRQVSMAQTVQKAMEVAPLQSVNKVVDVPVVAPRQIPIVQTVEETKEIPQLRCPDEVVDNPAVQVPRVHVVEKTAEIPQMQTVEKIGETPQTQMILSARTSERLGTAPVCQMTQAEIGEVIEIGVSIPAESASPVLVTAPVLENSPVVAGSVQPAHVPEDMALAHTVSCTDAAVAHATRPLPATTMAVAHRLVDEKPTDDMVSEIRDLKSDRVHIRELLGVLVRKERSAEAKAEIAARRLNRMERERDQESEAECEATLEEALADHSKVVRVIVDKWFVDKGFGFGKTPSGQIVFIHASAVQGADVLKIGTDARVEVVNDDARAQGGVSSQTCLGTRRVESGEGEGESKQGGPASEASSGIDC